MSLLRAATALVLMVLIVTLAAVYMTAAHDTNASINCVSQSSSGSDGTVDCR